jgi:hypothetical protein
VSECGDEIAELLENSLNFNMPLEAGQLALFIPVLPGLYMCLNLSASALN